MNKKFNLTHAKIEWIYLSISFIFYSFAHMNILYDSIAYLFMALFLVVTLVPIFYFKISPSIFATGALSYILVLYWLYFHKGYHELDMTNIVIPYLLCAAGVTVGMLITAVRQHELKLSTIRVIVETAFFSIVIGFWPVYPRLIHQFN